MNRTKGLEALSIGPDVPIVPVTHFSKFPPGMLEGAWSIVGPSVQRNLQRCKMTDLWTVFAAAYLEGLHHGSALAKETTRHEKQASRGVLPM